METGSARYGHWTAQPDADGYRVIVNLAVDSNRNSSSILAAGTFTTDAGLPLGRDFHGQLRLSGDVSGSSPTSTRPI